MAVSKFIVSDSFSISLAELVHLPGGAVAMVRLLGGPFPTGKGRTPAWVRGRNAEELARGEGGPVQERPGTRI